MQPHRYTRLAALFEQFSTCFNDADTVIVAHVYPAGEAPIAGADRDSLVQGLRAHGHRQVDRARRRRRSRAHRQAAGAVRRHRRLPRRRQHHAMGLRAAGRARGARGGGVRRSSAFAAAVLRSAGIPAILRSKPPPKGVQMNKALLAELMELSPAERLELVEELWDSIPPEDLPPLTEEQSRRSSGDTKRSFAIRLEGRRGKTPGRAFGRNTGEPQADTRTRGRSRDRRRQELVRRASSWARCRLSCRSGSRACGNQRKPVSVSNRMEASS